MAKFISKLKRIIEFAFVPVPLKWGYVHWHSGYKACAFCRGIVIVFGRMAVCLLYGTVSTAFVLLLNSSLVAH